MPSQRYIVRGLHRETRRRSRMELEAETETDAVKRAGKTLIVDKIELAPAPPPANPPVIKGRPASRAIDWIERVSADPPGVRCQACGGAMVKKTINSGGASSIVIGLMIVLLGAVMLFFFPLGTIVGLLVIVIGLIFGSRTSKVWRCSTCGFILPRA